MKLKFLSLLFFIFINSSSFAQKSGSDDNKKLLRLQSSLIFVPAGVFVTKSGFENSTLNKTNDPTGMGIGFNQSAMFRFHPRFAIGLSASFIFFLEKPEFTRALEPYITRVIGGITIPVLAEITIPIKTNFPLTEKLEFQTFLEAGVGLLQMPKGISIGVGPLFTPGIGLEYSFDKSSSKALSLNFDLAYSLSWISLKEERKINLTTPTYISSVNPMHYLQMRLGVSYNI